MKDATFRSYELRMNPGLIVRARDEEGISVRITVPENVEEDANPAVIKAFAVTPEQTHSTNAGIVISADERFPDTDALVTFQESLPIGIVTADCVPILLYAPDVRGAAAIHAGWKGTIGKIVEKAVNILMQNGADPGNIRAFFGPSISMEAYEVSTELANRFKEAGFSMHVHYPNGEGKKPHLDLQGINVSLLEKCGLLSKNILKNPDCTMATKRLDGKYAYFSYRRNPGNGGRILSSIELLPQQGQKLK